MVGMMQQMGAMPVVGPGAVANGAEPVWGPTRSSSTGDAGSADANKEILLRFIDALANADEAAASGLVDAGAFVDHNPGWGTTDLRSAVESHAALRRALPDLTFEVDRSNMVCAGNQVAAHSIVRGTHTGEALFGAEPSGGEMVWTHSDFVRLADGRIVERWTATVAFVIDAAGKSHTSSTAATLS
jgi:predicted ester cyclase